MFCTRFAANVRFILHHPLLLIILICVSVLNILPCFIPSYTGAEYYDSRRIQEEWLDVLQSSIDSGAFDSAPDYIIEDNNRLIELYKQSQTDNLAVKFSTMAKISEMELNSVQSGNLVGPTELECRAGIIYNTRLAQLKNPALYADTTQEPLWYRLAEIPRSLPTQIWFVIPALIGFIVFGSYEDDKIGGQLPCSKNKQLFIAALTCFVVCMLGFFIALIPVSFVSLIKNGMGEFSYPVVFLQGDSIIESTVGMTFIKGCLLWMGIVLFITSVESLCFSAFANASFGVVIAVIIGFIPYIPNYFGERFLFHHIVPFLPSTYMDLGSIVGWPLYYYWHQTIEVSGVSWQLGVAVFLACSVVLLILCFAGSAIKTKRVAA